ncbi:hypothetical protein evm_014178 [Chilo suppressalis]|nr:hypothetical protein evm_014178 [Chilo suppressalis]
MAKSKANRPTDVMYYGIKTPQKFICRSEDRQQSSCGPQTNSATTCAPDMKVNSPPCHSPGAILPDLPQPAEEPDKFRLLQALINV